MYRHLFEGPSNRDLDMTVLHLDPNHTLGFQTNQILHYYRLDDTHKGCLEGEDVQACIDYLDERGGDYIRIADCLRRHSALMEGDAIPPEFDRESVVEIGDSEGRKVEYYTTKYERSRRNREAAIRIHGARCMACGFDFGDVYGDLGDGFIEVHHIRPLSSRDEEVVVDPEKDLVCLCSNCHRMVHHIPGKVLSVEELRAVISNNREQSDAD